MRKQNDDDDDDDDAYHNDDNHHVPFITFSILLVLLCGAGCWHFGYRNTYQCLFCPPDSEQCAEGWRNVGIHKNCAAYLHNDNLVDDAVHGN